MSTSISFESPSEQFMFEPLPNDNTFRVVEVFPGKKDSPIICRLHIADWKNPPKYEAISYAWGDITPTNPIVVNGRRLVIIRSLYTALNHLRYRDRPRFLWADFICINRKDPEELLETILRSRKKKIYEKSQSMISSFLCKKLQVTLAGLKAIENVFELVFKCGRSLPVPDQCDFSSEDTWKTLAWFYSFPYYSRVWVIQEVRLNRERIVHCGHETIEWVSIELVAGYISLAADFSQRWGFCNTKVWHAATFAEFKQPENWLSMLYLASNYSCWEPKAHVYGLRGLMKFSNGADILIPDCKKTTLEVYRDSVEAALTNFENTDALLYVTGKENPSWIPAWNAPMPFRNPFPFGHRVPWKPARGRSRAIWSIDKSTNVLSLGGFIAGVIKVVQPYSEQYFDATMLRSAEGKAKLKANAFSFGLDEMSIPAHEGHLLCNFVAYLKAVLDEETYAKYISPAISQELRCGSVENFAKPVYLRDSTYPESSLFVTDGGLVGCCVSAVAVGDVVAVPLGCTYPLVLRPDGERFRIRGFTYTYGIMRGEKANTPPRVLQIC
ncbi:hypothetical protein Dda_7591 [Drechslerella dactyloides]|uniref:Heterokaryon incompatibility domain-containing protein n=1 Tax=Drechslerella dactyloides TaxID=74499 RepID=A0AAD6IWS5_DREDA|nr:hypothetical protein Dda_7591 [Drechslerella dactyloides]